MTTVKKINELWLQTVIRFSALFFSALFLISCSNSDTYTELMSASSLGDDEGVLRIIARGGKVNAQSKQGKTALILAANAGHASVVKTLLLKGAEIDHQDDNGTTALIAAASYNRTEAVKTLLAEGASQNIRDNNKGTPLINSIFFNYTETVKALLTRHKDYSKADLEEALLLASGLGNTIIVEEMLKIGINVNAMGHNDRTPIMAAINFDQPDTVKVLLKAGADINAKDSNGHTPLNLAFEQGNDKIIDMLKEEKSRLSKHK